MMSQPRSRAEQLIYQKRAQDQKLSNLQTKLKQEFHHKQSAKWENKGKDLEIYKQVRSQLQKMRELSQINLNSRREQLFNLLSEETQKYQEEIVASQETPEQTRQRMAERVKVLKGEKEERRKEEVNAKLERRFQQNADQLRKVDQELKQLKVAYERNIQMVERQNNLQNNYEEQMIFAELNRRDQKKKEEIERIKMIQQKQKIDERNAILAIQKQLRGNKIMEEKQLSEIEKQMLKEEWQKQSQLEKMKERINIEKNKELNKNLYQENQRQRRIKEEQILLQKQRDKEMIQRIVQKEKQLAEYEKLMKLNQREEAKRTLKGVKNKNLEMIAYEKQLDRLIEIQRLKKEKKEEEEWAKREKARVNLLYDVYHDRQRKLKDHQAQKLEEIKLTQQDKAEVERRVIQYQKQQQRKRQQEFIRNKREQENLLAQIAGKEEKRRFLLMQLQRQQQELEKGRSHYDRKIEERKEKGRENLQTFKKTNRLY